MEERAAVSPQKAAIPARGLVLVLVFLSGFCSLTYQVIWERTLKYCFGGDVVSASIIVSVFLLGLGLGGFLFRKVKARALPVLAVVELLIGLFGMWSYEIILRIDSILSRFSAGRGWGVESEFLLVFLGAFVFLLVPTVLMGATLPLMFESFIPKVAKNAKFIGLVYGINTLGAFAGALLPPLFFGSWGIPNTLRRTSALSLIIGTVLLAIALRKRKARAGLAEAVDAPEGIFRDRRNVFIVVFSFLSGFVALALEILFIRFIEILHSFSAYSFPLIVSAYLLAMGIGSMFWASRRDRMSAGKSRILPYVLQLLVAVLVPLAVFLFEFALRNKYAAFFNFFRMFQAATDLLDQGKVFLALRVFSIFCWPFLILIIPAVLVSSGIFPVLIKSLSESRLSLGKATGIVYLWNSIGCMAGSLVTGFAAIPVLGWHTSLILVTGLSLVAGGVGIFMEAFSGGARAEAALGRRTKLRYGLLLIAVAVASATIFSLSDAKIKYKLATGKYVAYTPLVSYREGVTGVAAAVKVDRGRNARVAIYSNGHEMSVLPYFNRFTYIANLPRLQDRLRSVLVLGLGGGRNLTDLLSDPRVAKVVAVDWSKEMIELVSTPPVTALNGNPFSDARLEIVMADAKKALKVFKQKGITFDAVIDNLCFPSWSGAGGVKSVQYFQSIRDILSPDGYYYHIPNTLNDRERKLILVTLAAVFDHLTFHNNRIVICGMRSYAPSEPRVREILTDDLLNSARDFFIAEFPPAGERYAAYLNWLTPLDRAKLPNVRPLTDEIPATEYYLTFPFLVREVLKGLRISD